MPPIYQKVSGVWKKIYKIYQKISDVWKIVDRGYAKVSGSWKLVHTNLPDDIIGLFTVDPGGNWESCNGVDDPLDLRTMFLRGFNDEAAAAGSHTHIHANQGFTTDESYNSLLTYPTAANGVQNELHYHSFTHGHTDATNHEPEYQEMYAMVGGKTLPADTLLFYNGAVAPTGWTAYGTVYDKFIKCIDTGGGISTGGNPSHSHTIALGSSNTNVNFLKRIGAGVHMFDDISHSHTATHTHSGGENYPEWHGLLPVRNDSEEGYIPPDIVAFFKSDVVPYGWSLCDGTGGTPDLQDKFIQGVAGGSVGNTGGANAHVHSHGFTYTTTSNGGLSFIDRVPRAAHNTHRHEMLGSHTSVSNLIYHKPLLICIKD